MSKKPKLKCPDCKSKEYSEDYHDCPTCDCGKVYCCMNCLCQFDENGEEL